MALGEFQLMIFSTKKLNKFYLFGKNPFIDKILSVVISSPHGLDQWNCFFNPDYANFSTTVHRTVKVIILFYQSDFIFWECSLRMASYHENRFYKNLTQDLSVM